MPKSETNNSESNNAKTLFDVTVTFITGLVSYTISDWIIQTFPGDIVFGLVIVISVILWFYIDRFIHENIIITISNVSWKEIWKYTLSFIKFTFIMILVRYWLDIINTIWNSIGIPWYELLTSGIIFFFLLVFFLLRRYTRKELIQLHKKKFLHNLYYNIHFRKYANQEKVKEKLKRLRENN